MNTLRALGVTFTPKPGQLLSQYTISDAGVGSASIALLVNLMRGMERRPCRAVLPLFHIGSTANEMTGSNLILRPRCRKQNQRVMNYRQSTSISGKHQPENRWGEGKERERRGARARRSAGKAEGGGCKFGVCGHPPPCPSPARGEGTLGREPSPSS